MSNGSEDGDLPPSLCGYLHFQREIAGVKHPPLDAELSNNCSSVGLGCVVQRRQACSRFIVLGLPSQLCLSQALVMMMSQLPHALAWYVSSEY